MQRSTGDREQLAAACQIEHVIDITTVSEAAARPDDSPVTQLTEVIRDEALRPAGQRAHRQNRHGKGPVSTVALDDRAGEPVWLKAASLLGVGRRSDAEGLIPRVKGSPGAALDLAQVRGQLCNALFTRRAAP